MILFKNILYSKFGIKYETSIVKDEKTEGMSVLLEAFKRDVQIS